MKLIKKCKTYSRKTTGLFFTGHGVNKREKFVIKYQAVNAICYFDNSVILVHACLNTGKSLDGHTRNFITSPLLKPSDFYLARKRK